MEKPTAALEKISPTLAASYLERNERNREPSKVLIRNFAAEISEGKWRINGETIKFDRDGRLIDGQHRLHAIVKADQPIECFVVRGLHPKAIETVDTGKNRSTADSLALAGVKYSNAVAGVLRMFEHNIRGNQKKRITNARVIELHRQFPEVATLTVRAHAKPYVLPPSFLSQTWWAYFFVMAHNVNAEECARYAATVSGAKRESKAGLAVYAQISEAVTREIVPAQRTRLSWIITGWNCHLSKRVPATFPDEATGLTRFLRRPYPGVFKDPNE